MNGPEEASGGEQAGRDGSDGDGPAGSSGADRGFDRLYDRAVGTLLTRRVEEAWIQTRYGRTHALCLGDPAAGSTTRPGCWTCSTRSTWTRPR